MKQLEKQAKLDSLEVLPLRIFTEEGWAVSALKDPIGLLSDHAHLEKKAAANALALLHRWPDGKAPEKWTRELSEIARDESQHLLLVIKLLEERGGVLDRKHKNDYAQSLRRIIRMGESEKEILDRLIVSALIEARSCERFALLGEASEDVALKKLYHGLWSSELGHYRSFLSLAEEFIDPLEVEMRWSWFLDREAEIIQFQEPGCRIHSWV